MINDRRDKIVLYVFGVAMTFFILGFIGGCNWALRDGAIWGLYQLESRGSAK